MKVYYEKKPPASRTRGTPPGGGTCFTLNWKNVAAGAQLFRKGWIKGAARKTQNFDENEFRCVVVSDQGVTFYFKDPVLQEMDDAS